MERVQTLDLGENGHVFAHVLDPTLKSEECSVQFRIEAPTNAQLEFAILPDMTRESIASRFWQPVQVNTWLQFQKPAGVIYGVHFQNQAPLRVILSTRLVDDSVPIQNLLDDDTVDTMSIISESDQEEYVETANVIPTLPSQQPPQVAAAAPVTAKTQQPQVEPAAPPPSPPTPAAAGAANSQVPLSENKQAISVKDSESESESESDSDSDSSEDTLPGSKIEQAFAEADRVEKILQSKTPPKIDTPLPDIASISRPILPSEERGEPPLVTERYGATDTAPSTSQLSAPNHDWFMYLLAMVLLAVMIYLVYRWVAKPVSASGGVPISGSAVSQSVASAVSSISRV